MFAGLGVAWIILSLETVLVFGYFIAIGRSHWSSAFWMLTGGLLVVHIAIVPLVFHVYISHFDHGMAFWMAVGTIMEMAAFHQVREKFLPKPIKDRPAKGPNPGDHGLTS